MLPGPMYLLVVIVLSFTAVSACEREARRLQRPSPPEPSIGAPREGEVQPGQPGPGLPTTARGSYNERNAYDVATGKRLFRWYNCNGCHGSGGGSYGPALMDRQWIYGWDPETIHTTILDGRPNGMPSFRGRIPDEQVWQLVAYVRSMSGQLRSDVAPSRSDSISGGEPENRRDREGPQQGPPSSSPDAKSSAAPPQLQPSAPEQVAPSNPKQAPVPGK